MLELSFRQTPAEQMVRIAASLIFSALRKNGVKAVPLSALADEPQYGHTASANIEPVGPKFVRITDLQDGRIHWDSVPYCVCPEPHRYLLMRGDILFARTGATTGKTYLVDEDAEAVFASYLIRVRPRRDVLAAYLYWFFQSDSYWVQIIEGKEGSAQPNVNGRKLMEIAVPELTIPEQSDIIEFLKAVRKRQDGVQVDLPPLPCFIREQREIVSFTERLIGKIRIVLELRQAAIDQTEKLVDSFIRYTFKDGEGSGWTPYVLGDFVTDARYGTSEKTSDDESGTPVLRMGNIQSGELVTEDLKYLHFSEGDKTALLLRHGDILVNRTNSAELVGKCAVFKLEGNFAFASYLIRLRIDSTRANPELLAAYINSSAGRAYMFAERKQMTGQANVNAQKLKNMPIRLPCLERQTALEAEIKRLRSVVGRISRQQSETLDQVNALVPSLLHYISRDGIEPSRPDAD